jgi:hypothetical protein
MKRGKATLDRSWSTALLCGSGVSELYFKPDDGNKVVVMTGWAVCRAYHCQECGAITIAATPPTD